uniref:Putative cytochrome n=1 Tax=Triatoma infestans TaxID=30076 RepID=A0A023F620_TRIIF
MIALIVLILAVSLCLWYIIKYHLWTIRVSNMTSNIPGPKPLPIIGNASIFADMKTLQDVYETITSLLDKYGNADGIAKVWLGPKPWILLGNPKYIEIILSSPDALQKEEVYDRLGLFVNGLFVRNGRDWRELRKPLDKLLTKKMIDSNIGMFHEKTVKLLKILNKYTNTRNEFDLRHYMTNLAIDFISVTTFGHDMNMIEKDENNLKETLERIFETIVKLVFETPYNMWLTYAKISIPGRRLKELAKIYWRFCNELLQGRLRNKKLLGEDIDAVPIYYSDVLIEKATKDKLSLDERGKLATDFLIAGFDTSAVTLSYVLFILAMFSEHQEAVYQEQIDILGEDPEVAPTWEQLSKMEYLTRIIKEVMRLYCPLGIFRKLTNDIDLGDYKLPKGIAINLMFYKLHTNPKIWSHPNEFYPDHFLPEEMANRPKGSYLPFSLGPRSCPGSVYAMISIKTAVSAAIRRYKFETDMKFEKLEYKYNFLLEPAEAYSVRISERKTNC